MEYLQNQRRQLDEETAKKMIRVLIETVMACHKRGIFHRDLKPDNVMMENEDDPMSLILIDFGFSREMDQDFFRSDVGTASYIAPEILKSEGYNKSADIWSLGATFYAMYLPFLLSTIDSPQPSPSAVMRIFTPRAGSKRETTSATVPTRN